MPLQRRLPKRGFVSLTRSRMEEIRLSDLNNLPVTDIDLLTLIQANLVSPRVLAVKVILSGVISRAVTLKGINTTQGAKAAILAAGGSVAE